VTVPTRAHLAAALSLAALALPASAQPIGGGPTGLSAFADLGGGGAAAGSRRDASSGGIFEAEAGAGYEVGQGLRPELALVLGLAPTGYLGLRPGLRLALSGMPFSVRGALDFAAPHGSWRMRWVLGGGAAEIRITDLLGLYGGADLGIPVASKAGFAFLLRAGVSFRL
jgi:hypothetical protein